VRPHVRSRGLGTGGNRRVQELLSIEEDVRSIGAMPYTVRVGNHEPQAMPDPEALEAFISERGKKGMQISATKASAK